MCGLVQRTFWMVLAIVILLVCVVVAAAVGGSIAATRRYKSIPNLARSQVDFTKYHV